MESRITCKNCQQKLWIICSSPEIRCPSCKAINQLTTSEDRSNTSLRGKMFTHSRSQISANTDSYSWLNMKPSPSFSPTLLLVPRKRALLCGVSYMKKKKLRLKGTIGDVKNIRDLLLRKFGFPMENICVLTEEEADLKRIPTKKNIENGLQWLVKDCRAGDSLVFFFTGHGNQQPDCNGDELDGLNETICPLDFETEGIILDNYLNSTIVRPLTKGVTLHAIVDACHSGTILDLQHMYNYQRNEWNDNSLPSGVFKGTSGGIAICISACGDYELAADTDAFTKKTMNGAMTYSLVRAIDINPKITYGDLLSALHHSIIEANDVSGIFSKLFHTKLSQNPQLSSSEKFDVHKKEFKL